MSQAEDITRERERLAVALSAGQIGVYEWRVSDQTVWWSPDLYSVYGVDPATFTPTVEAFAALVHPDDREELWRRTQQSIDRREVFSFEYRIVRPDGTVAWVANRSHVGLDESGQVVRITGIALDITDLKRQEEALRLADRRKNEFLAMLAHELRSPLAPIRNAVQVLRALGPREPTLDRMREIIERQSAQLARLVDDLLDVSRVTQGKIVLKPEPLDLGQILYQALETSRPLLDAHGHHITLQLPPPGTLLVLGDGTRLVQAIGNLLNNAAKFTDDGGHIALSGTVVGDQVVVSVRDDGIGIPAELLPHVFDLFTQSASTLERAEGGLGIGLALARSLVTMHGGSIEVASAPGHGSTFTVRLPYHPVPGIPVDPGEVPAQASVPRRILVVDDNHDAAHTIGTLLELLGHVVLEVHDAADALTATAEFRPEVCMLDLGLPGMNGFVLARRLRAMPEGRDAIFIALTSHSLTEDHRADPVFDHYLTKPAEPGEVYALIGR